jgi:hypothetical protein
MNEGREGSIRKLIQWEKFQIKIEGFVLANDVYENISAINEANGKRKFIIDRRVSNFMILDVAHGNLLPTHEQNKNSR